MKSTVTAQLKFSVYMLVAICVTVIAFIASMMLGQAHVSPHTIWTAIFQYDASNQAHNIIVEIRLPRDIGALIVGMALAVSGAVIQGVTKNGLADPSLIGLNAGAAFALAATFVFYPEAPFFVVILFSFMGAILGGVFVLSVGASQRGGYQPMRLILAGAAISALLTALSQGLALTYRLNQSINFWNAGGISSTTWQHLSISVPLVVTVTLILMLMRRQLTILSLGDAIAKGLGQNTTRISIIALLLTMLLAGISVAMVGQIAFVGLIIPHLVRFLVGTDYEKILPLSALFGGALVLIADIIARLLGEAPMSAIIAFIGVPFFLYLIKKGGRLV